MSQEQPVICRQLRLHKLQAWLKQTDQTLADFFEGPLKQRLAA